MVLGRVEVDVVADGERPVQLGGAGRDQQVLDRLPVDLVGEPGLQGGPDLFPGAVPGGKEQVQVAVAEQVGTAGQQPPVTAPRSRIRSPMATPARGWPGRCAGVNEP